MSVRLSIIDTCVFKIHGCNWVSSEFIVSESIVVHIFSTLNMVRDLMRLC